MPSPILNRDLQPLFAGAAAVATAGLLLGVAMRPDLDAAPREGAQVQIPAGGPREAYAADDPGLAAYHGRVPDYVIGADWTRPPPAEYPAEPMPEPSEAADAPEDDRSADPPSQAPTPDVVPPMPVRHVTVSESPLSGPPEPIPPAPTG